MPAANVPLRAAGAPRPSVGHVQEFSPLAARGRGYLGGMTRRAAHKLARLLRAQGYKVRVTRHVLAGGRAFYTVANAP